MLKKITLTLSLLLSLSAVNSQPLDLTKEPVQVVIPFSPGGGVDATFKSLMNYLETKNIKMVPNYKPGAEGLIGMNEIAKAKNDGYTIGIVTTGNIAVYQTKNKTENISPIMGIRNAPVALVVKSTSTIRNFTDYTNTVKNDPQFSFGFAAPAQRMYFGQILEFTKIKQNVNMVPYKGGANVLSDLLGGHITSAILPYNLVAAHIDSGALRLIGINSQALPANSTHAVLFAKQFSKWEDFDWYCLVLPPDANEDVVKTWVSLINQYLDDAKVKEEFKRDGIEFVPRDTKSAQNTVKTFILKSGVN